MQFTDPFDETLALHGPAAIFTCTHDGELQLNVMRTRDLRRQHQPPFPHEYCHCLIIDHATGWVEYALITSPVLCSHHERANIQRYASYNEAQEALQSHKEAYWDSERL